MGYAFSLDGSLRSPPLPARNVTDRLAAGDYQLVVYGVSVRGPCTVTKPIQPVTPVRATQIFTKSDASSKSND